MAIDCRKQSYEVWLLAASLNRWYVVRMGRIIQQPDLITDKGLIMAKQSKRSIKKSRRQKQTDKWKYL